MIDCTYMNEFVAKKLVEVLAFCNVGLNTFNKGQMALGEVLEANRVNEIRNSLSTRAKLIEEMVKGSDSEDVTLAKAKKTGAKLTSMRDMYIGEEWDNPTELMEWSGFFEGAAIVHWEFVSGAAKGIGNEELTQIAASALAEHKDTLNTASHVLNGVGLAKSSI